MFMGTFYNSIDAKNRMIVPAKHREQLGGRCIITTALDFCLNIYTLADWDKQIEKIQQLPESDPYVRAFVRQVFANAQECEFDKQGRIVIPSEQIKYAHIQKDLITMGAMNKIEVWSKEVWEAPNNESKVDDIKQFSATLAQYNY